GQVADDRLDVAADVADLGVLGGLDLEEGCANELGEPASDLGLADAGGADHDDVLRRHVLAQVGGQLLAAPAGADGDGDGPLGRVLADDVLVQLLHDLARGQISHGCSPKRFTTKDTKDIKDAKEQDGGFGSLFSLCVLCGESFYNSSTAMLRLV